MSRIGKKPITVPSGVKVNITGKVVSMTGPKGTVMQTIHPAAHIAMEKDVIQVTRQTNEGLARSIHGLTRTLISNMVDGVSKGYTKDLEIQGVGFKALPKGKFLEMHLGFTKPVQFVIPEGIKIEVDKEKQQFVKILGADRQLVGQVAANLRRLKPVEPYKGKGIRYAGEVVRRKAGKAAAGAGK